MNLLTFDIEEWYAEQLLYGSRQERFAAYDAYLDQILERLDQRQMKATFFCVGEMGRLYSSVIRKIHDYGHEVGCHSNTHTWLNKMSEAECREDTHKAVDSLEQCIGEKVVSYRAPAFSIGRSNPWAFAILAEQGIEIDASVFPANRELGGFSGFGHKEPCIIDYQGVRIKEFPVNTAKVLTKETAYSGGGYFRIFPLSFVKKEIRKSNYAMCYFHIGDLIPEVEAMVSKEVYESYLHEKATLKARYLRHLKANLGKKNAFGKMMRLLDEVDFEGLREANARIDWNLVPVVTL